MREVYDKFITRNEKGYGKKKGGSQNLVMNRSKSGKDLEAKNLGGCIYRDQSGKEGVQEKELATFRPHRRRRDHGYLGRPKKRNR